VLSISTPPYNVRNLNPLVTFAQPRPCPEPSQPPKGKFSKIAIVISYGTPHAWKEFGIEYIGNCPMKDRWRSVGITPIPQDEKG
jgi:hypothetical protein